MNKRGFGAGFYYILGALGLVVSATYLAVNLSLYAVESTALGVIVPYLDAILPIFLVVYGVHSFVNSNEMALVK